MRNVICSRFFSAGSEPRWAAKVDPIKELTIEEAKRMGGIR